MTVRLVLAPVSVFENPNATAAAGTDQAGEDKSLLTALQRLVPWPERERPRHLLVEVPTCSDRLGPAQAGLRRLLERPAAGDDLGPVILSQATARANAGKLARHGKTGCAARPVAARDVAEAEPEHRKGGDLDHRVPADDVPVVKRVGASNRGIIRTDPEGKGRAEGRGPLFTTTSPPVAVPGGGPRDRTRGVEDAPAAPRIPTKPRNRSSRAVVGIPGIVGTRRKADLGPWAGTVVSGQVWPGAGSRSATESRRRPDRR